MVRVRASRPFGRVLLCGLLGVIGWTAGVPLQAQSKAKVPDPDPELERKTFLLPEEFEVNLFAADPLLAKPIQMNFDPAGRLWVACSEVYPQIKPGQKANDKIIILEDTKGVGRADKTTVFADGLLIPTGVEPGDGGAYVADSTDLVHFSDPGPDGKARKRRIVLSGFGTEDTHHIIHTFRWGPDGMLYFNQSIYIHSHVETPYGPRRLNAGGIWQFRPETMRLEVFCRGFYNTWGHHFDSWGQSFATDGAHVEGIIYLMPGAYFVASQGGSRILAGLNPGSPKHCGLEILSGRHLPEDWRGNMITNDFRANRVCRFVVREDGAGFASQEKVSLIRSTHPAFRPVDVKMGPDGAIYVADWYNPIIQHGEVDFRDPRRDVTHGRIWRITAKGRPLVPRPKLVDAAIPDLLDALKQPEGWTRQQAKRVLKERGARTVLPELANWTRQLDARDPQREHQLLEALWTYQSLDVVEPALLTTLLNAKDHHVRAAATRVLSYWHSRLGNATELLAHRIADDHPQVRLEAVRALGQIPERRSAEIALRALDRPLDRWLDYGLWLTLRELTPQWLPALQQGTLDFGGNPQHLVFALQAAGVKEGAKPLVQLLKAGKIAKDREESVLGLITVMGSPADLGYVFDRVFDPDGNVVARQAALLTALEEATRQRGVVPSGDPERLRTLLNSEHETIRAVAARTAGLWKVEALRPLLLERCRAERTSVGERQAVIDGLVALGGKSSQDALEELTDKNRPSELRCQAVVGLTKLDVDRAARRAVDVLTTEPTGCEVMIAAFVERKNGATVLAKALAGKKLPADVAKIGIRAVRASGRDAPDLVEAFNQAGSLTTTKLVLTPTELERLAAEVAKNGNASRGEAIFRRKDLSCLKCHAIAGAGGQVGPDLTSIGASAPVDYLIESIIVPDKIIKEGFHAHTVSTLSGKIITGIKVRESKTELVLRDVEDREITIPAKEIDEQVRAASLMPAGQADVLTRAELVDLVRFLSELGKVGPYAVSQNRFVRRWQVLEPTPAVRELLRRTQLGSAAGGDPTFTWTSAYSQVSGRLPLDALPRIEYRKDQPAQAFVRFQLDVTTAGKVKLVFDSVMGLTAWLDGVPLELDPQRPLDLSVGVRTLVIAINLEQRKEALLCELEDVTNSPARVRVISGK